jgi:hypothetical protein
MVQLVAISTPAFKLHAILRAMELIPYQQQLVILFQELMSLVMARELPRADHLVPV